MLGRGGKGRVRKGPEENPSFSLELRVYPISLSTATHPSVSIPPFLSLFPPLSLYLLPLIFPPLRPSSLFAYFSLSLTHTHTSEPASHTLRLQLGKIQRLPLFPEPFQFGTEPLGHCGTAQCLHTPPY